MSQDYDSWLKEQLKDHEFAWKYRAKLIEDIMKLEEENKQLKQERDLYKGQAILLDARNEQLSKWLDRKQDSSENV